MPPARPIYILLAGFSKIMDAPRYESAMRLISLKDIPRAMTWQDKSHGG